MTGQCSSAWHTGLSSDPTSNRLTRVPAGVHLEMSWPRSACDTEIYIASTDYDVARHLADGTIAKEIYVPGRLVNFVVR